MISGDVIPHGLKGYRKGCRCEVCRAEMSRYSTEYWRANRERRLTQRATRKAEKKKKDAEYHLKHPSKSRVGMWKMKGIRGFSYRDFLDLLNKQNHRCSICGKRLAETRKRAEDGQEVAQLDHDHSTGMVRSLLCYRCNLAIGLLMDDPEIAMKASLYLKEHQRAR